MNDESRKALRLRMERGLKRRLVLIGPEEVLELLDMIDALKNDLKIARTGPGYDPYGRTIVVGGSV